MSETAAPINWSESPPRLSLAAADRQRTHGEDGGIGWSLYTPTEEKLHCSRHVERLTRRGHSLHLAFCSNLSFSSDSVAIETGKRDVVSFDVKATALISTD